MVKNILGTTGTRILNAFVNLIILISLTRELGSEGFGVIMLVLLAITIIQLFIDLIAGSALIYFTPRTSILKLLLPSYLWIAIIISLSYFLLGILSLHFQGLYSIIIPDGYEMDIIVLASLNALMLTNYNILLGSKRIGIYNIIFTIQVLALLLVLTGKLFYLNEVSVDSWVTAVYYSYMLGYLLSLIAVLYKIRSFDLSGGIRLIVDVFKYGFTTQVANMLHMGNKRISLYFLNIFTGINAVGIYGAGTQLTEGLRLIGQSISLVQFSEISNSNSKEFAKIVTIKLMKFSVILTICALLILVIIPTSIYEYVFTSEFENLKIIIVALSPGVIALSINTIFSHYFSGLGRPIVSLWANAVGMIVTVVLAIVLIPKIGYVGAAITASFSYISTVIYQYRIFSKETNTTFQSWVPNGNDIKDLKNILQNFKRRS